MRHVRAARKLGWHALRFEWAGAEQIDSAALFGRVDAASWRATPQGVRCNQRNWWRKNSTAV